jgi:aminoglycoside phosphotransferase
MNMVLSFIEENRTLPALSGLPESLSTLILTPRFDASRHVIFLVMTSGQRQPILVAKIPRMPQFSDHLTHEAHVLQTIQGLRPGGFRSIPQIITYKEYHGYPILLETALNGQLMSPDMVRRNPERMLQITRDWLLEMQSNSIQPHDDCWYAELVESLLIVLREDFPLTASERDLLQRCEEYLAVLKDLSLPYALQHGDLSHPNIVMTGPNTIGVLDWELATIRGLVASDYFFFLSFVAFSLSRANDSRNYISAFDKAFFDGHQAGMQPYIQAYATAFKLQRDVVPALFLLCWLRYLILFIERLRVRKTDPISMEAANIVRKNRYYAIWKHTIKHFERLAI